MRTVKILFQSDKLLKIAGLIILFLSSPLTLQAQFSISGVATAVNGDIEPYTLLLPNGSTVYWGAIGGSVSSTSTNVGLTNTTFTANIVWNQPNANNKVTADAIVDMNIYELEKAVTVSPLPPLAPYPAPTSTQACGITTLSRGAPPAGVVYYWQGTNSAGTSTSNSSSTYDITTAGTYYLRAYESSTGLWSTSSSSIVASVNLVPNMPPVPNIVLECNNTVLTQPTAPSGITYYWQSTSTGTDTGNSSASINMASAGTYYLRAKNNSTGCWGPAKTVNYGFNNLPVAPPTPAVNLQCNNTELERAIAPTGFTYYWQSSSSGTSTGVSTLTVNMTNAGTYYLRSQNNNTGCWSPATPVTYDFNALPSTAPVPTVTNNCGSTVLTSAAPPSGITYYWQGSSGETSTADASPTLTVTSGTGYYIRPRNNSTGCWGTATYVGYTINALPSTAPVPTVTNNCGSTVLTSAAPPSGITYYWQGSSGGTSTADASPTLTVTSGTGYYIRPRNNSTGCWGTATYVGYTINALPSTAPVPTVTNNCGSSVLTSAAPPSGITYYWQGSSGGTSTAEASPTLTVTSGTGYYIRPRNNSTGCWGTATYVGYTINAIPSTAPVPTVTNNCGSTVLTSTTPPSGITYYWQGSSGGTSTADASPTLTVTSGTGYYIRPRNNSTGCWGADTYISFSITALPAAPPAPMVSNKFESSDLFMPSLTGDIAYYWQGTDPNGTSTGNFSSIYTVTSSGTYYLRSQNSSGCWGGSVGVNVTVEAKPTISVMGNTNLGNLGDKVTFSSQATYDSYTWKRDGVTVGANPSYEARQEGNYTLTVSKIGVLGTAESTGVDVIGCADVDPGDENYIMSTTVLTSGITSGETTDSQISLLTSDYRSVLIQYADGLGRSIQSVGIEASPDKKHIVQPIVYDAYGRKDIGYLPYVVTDNCGIFQSNPVGTAMVPYNLSPQFEFYQAENDNIANDIAPYAVTVFEASPLNRVLKQGAPGAAWQPVEGSGTDKIVRMAYELNVANEVRLFRLDGNGLITPSSIGYYGAGELMVSVVQDEQGNETAQYTDKRGQVVLKKVSTGDVTYPWAETYYIYDDFGNLTFVLPPEANKAIIAGDLNSVPAGFTLVTTDLIVTNANYTGGSYMYLDGASVSIEPDVTLNPDMEIIPYAIGIDFLDTWAFQYKYDHRNRMSEKRVPGAGWVYMVYDDLDRLVATQDANQRSINQWTFTKYDALSRPVLTGFYTNVAADQSAMQAVVNGYSTLFESIGSTVLGYTNNAFPSVSNANDYLSATYYDSYTNLTTDFTFTYAQELGNPATNNTKVKGQVVGSKTKMLDGSNIWLKNTMYYDDRYRVIQTVGDNQFGSTDRSTTKYDFAGRAIQTKTTHIDATATTTLAENYSYDHASRLLEIDHSINGATAITMVKNEYNELGELIDKKLHSTDGTNFEQSVDYRYNIRGWLGRINDATLSDGENDYFGMELGYNNSLSGISNTALYNGNISGAKWSNYNGGTGMESAYNYSYDAMNRIKGADFREKAGTWADVAKFGLNGLTYDLNGNIKNLTRYHTSASTPMDDLIYTYEGNRLMSVLDNGDDTEGFKDGNTTGNDYAYDDNGNMVSDLNKDITSITYNHLNLPNVVTFTGNRSITYTYDAAGIKLKKVANDNGTAKTTIYSGGFIYEDGEMQQLATAEGRIRKKDNGSFVYDYYLKDHLGNTRITFTTENEVVEYLATMETELATYEDSLFLNLSTRDSSLPIANTTNEPGITNNETARLRGNDVARQIGPGKLLEVNRGDVVDMEANAYHTGSYTDNGSNLGSYVATLVGMITSTAPIGNEGSIIQNSVNNNSSLIFVGANGDTNAPRAYLNYILFDQNFDYLDTGFEQVGSATNTYHSLTRSKTIPEKGYIYVYVSNESDNSFDVYFDDLRITHTKGKVIQEDHYYPFGLSINALSSRALLSKPNKYNTFQGQERTEDFDLGWYSFKWRNHDPTIGRFFNVDPLAESFYYNSPYAFSENHVTSHIELEGLEAIDIKTGKTIEEKPFGRQLSEASGSKKVNMLLNRMESRFKLSGFEAKGRLDVGVQAGVNLNNQVKAKANLMAWELVSGGVKADNGEITTESNNIVTGDAKLRQGLSVGALGYLAGVGSENQIGEENGIYTVSTSEPLVPLLPVSETNSTEINKRTGETTSSQRVTYKYSFMFIIGLHIEVSQRVNNQENQVQSTGNNNEEPNN